MEPEVAKKPGIPLHTRIFLGLLVGAALGIGCRIIWGDAQGLRWVATTIANPIGQVFLRLVLMAVIPIVFSALALGVADLGEVSWLGRIGLRTLLFTIPVRAGPVSLVAGSALLLWPASSRTVRV